MRTANAPLAQEMNIGVHLLDTNARTAKTQQEVSSMQFAGVVLIQGNLWTRTVLGRDR